MNVNEIRTRYIEFFKARGHLQIPSASLVPQNDPTTLFTGSGMQPLLPYLLGETHPKGSRLVDSQKSFRAEDIEEVGDNRHTTFFEMLGNWSLGDYFKKEQIEWIFEFLTEEAGIDPNKLYVTCFIGAPEFDIPKDVEAAEVWQRLFTRSNVSAGIADIGSEEDGYARGMKPGERIFYYDGGKNWWNRGKTGPNTTPVGDPCGPDSEMFYDFGTPHDPRFGTHCHPNCDCGRFLEIGNNVFMTYRKVAEDKFEPLDKPNIDHGSGLERIAAAVNDNPDLFLIDVFKDVIDLLGHFSGKSYEGKDKRSFRIIADHMRAVVFMLADGVRSSNTARGYVLRRLIRRAAQHAQKLEVERDQRKESMLNRCASIIIEKYKAAYPELSSEETYEMITNEIWKEEKQFGHTLENGMKELDMILQGLISDKKAGEVDDFSDDKPQKMSGEQAFTLFTTYGFPFEMTLEIARECGIEVDKRAFEELMEKHQELSRAGSEQKFKGGLLDHSEQTTRLHTAHHLLLKALQSVLGPEVKQRGSNITSARLRIDFSYGAKMTPEQIAEVERIVNEKISEELPVIHSSLPKEDAEKLGAEHEFGAKYPDIVSVYSIGPKDATADAPQFDHAFSIEFCGGPHVSNTKELSGHFKIVKEEAVASGIRRIKAILE
ncbi:MAG TPA: alanine--tRNA ligase [Candidatus Paceibacterota bacterium]|nr:alanine--tRNA ligase [Candidatus Paceibacterota bacterium]